MATRFTSPTATSAPLPPDWPIRLPTRTELAGEIERSATELRWALHRQRTTWAHLAKVRAEYRDKGNGFFYENERRWKLATGDVTWWRGEVNSRANALSALCALAALQGIPIDDYMDKVD